MHYYHIQQYYKLQKNTRERWCKLEHITGSECIPKDVIEKQQGHIGQEQKQKRQITFRLSSVGYGDGQSCHSLPEIGSQGPGCIWETVHMMLIYPKRLIPESCTGFGLPAPDEKIQVLYITTRKIQGRTIVVLQSSPVHIQLFSKRVHPYV